MIVATAGHVDHGKTSLIKQLTGVDTDRLEEEKRRGLSINLGFAYGRVDEALVIGYIDVPGHNRFINTMIAGVSGIDLGMLVVAADDGPMPQTIEHLDVMRLLGVSDYVVVITRIDRVDQTQVAKVNDTIQALLAGSCPAFAVNNLDGSGIPELKKFLYCRAEQCGARSDGGYFRLSIDRSFLLKGTGLVVTGTAISGKVSVGDTLQLLPQAKSLRVRTIHAQDEETGTGQAGQRCALSVVGDVSRDQINRGDYLLDEKIAISTTRFDARLHLLATAPFGLKHLAPVKLYMGASRKPAKLFLLQKKGVNNKLSPGESGLVQLIISGELACCSGDRFLLRDDSESVTLGGGIVLDPYAPRTAKSEGSRLAYLAAMEAGAVVNVLKTLLIDHHQVVDLSRFKKSWNLRDVEANLILSQSILAEKIKLFVVDGTEFAVAAQNWSAAEQALGRSLAAWHKEEPEERGIPQKELNGRLDSSLEPALLKAVMISQQKRGLLNIGNGFVSASTHQAVVSSNAQRQWATIEQALVKHGSSIPKLANLQLGVALDDQVVALALRAAVRSGTVVQLTQRRFALPAVVLELADSVNELASSSPQFSTTEFRNHAGLSRNLSVDLLEYFDSIRFTKRDGNIRSVIDAKLPARYFKLELSGA